MVTKEEVEVARVDAERAHIKLGLAKDIFKKAEECYYVKSKRFRQLDYELAKVDGRLKVLPPSGTRIKKEVKPAELSLDQIKSIMEKLGITISIDEGEETLEVEDEKEV